eukprot:1388618-Amphidinium_carterae.1
MEPARAGQPEPVVEEHVHAGQQVQAGPMEPAHAGHPEPSVVQHRHSRLWVPNQTECVNYAEPPCQPVQQLPVAPEL